MRSSDFERVALFRIENTGPQMPELWQISRYLTPPVKLGEEWLKHLGRNELDHRR